MILPVLGIAARISTSHLLPKSHPIIAASPSLHHVVAADSTSSLHHLVVASSLHHHNVIIAHNTSSLHRHRCSITELRVTSSYHFRVTFTSSLCHQQRCRCIVVFVQHYIVVVPTSYHCSNYITPLLNHCIMAPPCVVTASDHRTTHRRYRSQHCRITLHRR